MAVAESTGGSGRKIPISTRESEGVACYWMRVLRLCCDNVLHVRCTSRAVFELVCSTTEKCQQMRCM